MEDDDEQLQLALLPNVPAAKSKKRFAADSFHIIIYADKRMLGVSLGGIYARRL
jgi:hypothetical protein